MVNNPTKIYFGNDNGWLPLYTAIFQAGYPTINNLKKIRLMITPYDGKGGNYAKGIRRRIWINDVLVIDDLGMEVIFGKGLMMGYHTILVLIPVRA